MSANAIASRNCLLENDSMTNLSGKIYLRVFVVLAIVLFIQMSAIARPYTGHFASYQATVMAAIGRNMVRENFKDLLRPKTDIMITSSERSLHLNQYPFPAVLAATGVRILGGSFEFWGRFQSILFNLLTAFFLGLLTRRLFDAEIAWIAVVLYLFSPYTLIYGQSFISEPCSLFFFVLSLFLIVRDSAVELPLPSLLASAFSLSIALTGRIHLLIFYPLFFISLWTTMKERRILKILAFSLIALLMPVAWYGYTYFASLAQENVHTNIFVQIGLSDTSAAALTDLTFLRHLGFIFIRTILTPVLVVFFFWGLLSSKREGKAFWLPIIGCALGGFVILLAPQKVMDHDFYLYGMFPFVVMVTACGVKGFFDKFPGARKWHVPAIAVYLAFSFMAFRNPIYKGLEEEKQEVRIAEKVRPLIGPSDRVIVASSHPAVLLYYLDRPVWNMDLSQIGQPLAPYLKNRRFRKFDPEEIDRLETAMKDPVKWLDYYRSKGADYLIVPDRHELDLLPGFLSHLRANYVLVSGESDEFCLFRLPK